MTTHWPISPATLGDRRSVSQPITTRKIAPARIGVATSRPRSWVVRCRSVAICTASGPSRYHTIKLRSKYKKAANRVGAWPAFQKPVFIGYLEGKRAWVGSIHRPGLGNQKQKNAAAQPVFTGG